MTPPKTAKKCNAAFHSPKAAPHETQHLEIERVDETKRNEATLSPSSSIDDFTPNTIISQVSLIELCVLVLLSGIPKPSVTRCRDNKAFTAIKFPHMGEIG